MKRSHSHTTQLKKSEGVQEIKNVHVEMTASVKLEEKSEQCVTRDTLKSLCRTRKINFF